MLTRYRLAADDADHITLSDATYRLTDRLDRPIADYLRERLEAAPWATVIASGRWATMLVDVTAQHLHLCLRGAVLINPVVRMVADGRHILLAQTPLAYPTVILTSTPKIFAAHAQAWGSHVLTHDHAEPIPDEIDAALTLLTRHQN